jgi:hypothetical protein
MREDFLSSYLIYTKDNECPVTFHRWSALTVVGAWLGRRLSFQLGHFKVNPNLYVMLMGSPGTRKSTAVKIGANLIKQAGYTNVCADRVTKEKFLLDLAGEDREVNASGILDANLFGSASDAAEILIAADEFNNFIGHGNIEFLSLLGVLWDHNGSFQNRVKNSKSIEIQDPTVSILSGNTPTGFSLAFPVESIGQGIFSRLLLVHGEPSGRKITFPEPPTTEETAIVLDYLVRIRSSCYGTVKLTAGSKSLLDHIYKGWKGIEDVRFESYSNRRFTHLLKLCIIIAACRCSITLSEEDVIYANTILTHAEHTMPQALGSFGKARHSDVSHKLLQILDAAHGLLTLKDLWKHLHTDLEKLTDLADILKNLVAAEKILQHQNGFLLKRKLIEESSDSSTVDYSFLTPEERKYIA